MVHKIFASLSSGGWMFYDTAWALILGFTLSGIVQAFATSAGMESALGDHRFNRIAKASVLGALSSSCSYAASALAHSLFKKGADFTTAMVFMFASTNLVIELGAVLWLLMGWQFALAEFVGGIVMISLLTIILPRIVPQAQARRLRMGDSAILAADSSNAISAISSFGSISLGLVDKGLSTDRDESVSTQPSKAKKMSMRDIFSRTNFDSHQRARFTSKLQGAAGYTIGDFLMLRYELFIGFIVAGFAATVVPQSFWNSLFLTHTHLVGQGGATTGQSWIAALGASLINAVMGPFLAFISFVCSVGNVPLAAALWSGGATFGGVIAFIFADLVSFPLVAIYFKYYGKRLSIKLVLTFWAVMALSGLITQGIFGALHIVPAHRTIGAMSSTHFGFNATTILNAIALIVFIFVIFLYEKGKTMNTADESEFAQDPICLMQVRKASAPATAVVDGQTYYFCMEGCKTNFLENR